MAENEFINFWDKKYPEATPINHELKWVYKDRWFRIHSLPESKRYAESDAEYQIIFDRQNQLIDDLIGDGKDIIVSYGVYIDEVTANNQLESTEFGDFSKSHSINLQELRPEEYEDLLFFEVFVKRDIWRTGMNNPLLKAIADDQIRAMIICPSENCIISPYDGGVDIIVESTAKRDELKVKYINWTSDREDGM